MVLQSVHMGVSFFLKVDQSHVDMWNIIKGWKQSGYHEKAVCFSMFTIYCVSAATGSYQSDTLAQSELHDTGPPTNM